MEVTAVVGMLATFSIQAMPGTISVWSSIEPFLYLRALFWIPGLLFIPGLALARLIPPLSAQPRVVKVVLAPVTSFAVFGTLAVLVEAVSSLSSLPWVALATTVVLVALSWSKSKGSNNFRLKSIDLKRMHLGYYLLIATALASMVIAILFLLSWNYLYPQDTWVSMIAGVKLIEGRSVLEAFSTSMYPVAFGYIIAGLSICTGFPMVNAQALLFPFTALEVLSIFALARVVFRRGIYTSALASLIFGFSGGFGWMLLVSLPSWNNYYMYIGNLTKDLYFGPFFFYSFFFYYKSLALMMAFASIIVFSISSRTTHDLWKVATAVLSSLLMIWAFMIHMLPALLAPMVIVISFISTDRRQHLKSLLLYVASALGLFFAMDLMIERIYTELVFIKGIPLLSAIISSRSVLFIGGLAAALAATLVVLLLMRRGSLKLPEKAPLGSRLKLAVALALLAVYLLGGLFFSSSTYSLSPSTIFPWYLYVTRYGFIGVLAIVGLYTSRWNAEWLKISIVWALIAIAMGSLWWGERLNSYLFPVVAILAGVGLVNSAIRASSGKPNSHAQENAHGRDPRWVIILAVLTIGLALSFTSTAYSASNFLSPRPMVTDDMVNAYNWAADNTEFGTKFIGYKHPFTLGYGISTLADRWVVDSTQFSPYSVAQVPQLVANLTAQGVRYFVVDGSTFSKSDAPSVIKVLQYYSDLVYRSGNITISAIPPITLPGDSAQTVSLDRGQVDDLRFLTIAIPSLWPTGYAIANNLSMATNASVIFTPYDSSIYWDLPSFREGSTVILTSTNLLTPAWGSGWATLFPGAIEGTYEGLRIIIVESDSTYIMGNLTAFSQKLYEAISG